MRLEPRSTPDAKPAAQSPAPAPLRLLPLPDENAAASPTFLRLPAPSGHSWLLIARPSPGEPTPGPPERLADGRPVSSAPCPPRSASSFHRLRKLAAGHTRSLAPPSHGALQSSQRCAMRSAQLRSEEHTSELQSLRHLVCR